jgi:hypothetical protein
MPRVPNWVVAPAVAVVLGMTGLLAAAPAVARDDDYPRILAVNASRPPQVEVQAVVPPLLAGQTLPIDAFEVVENGRQRPVMSVTRLPPTALRVLLVLDTAVPPATLAAEQGAAREFVFELPPQVRVGVVATDPEPNVVSSPDTDRSATVRAIIGLKPTAPSSTNDMASTLELALSQLMPAQGTGVVVTVDSRPVATALSAGLSRAATTARAAVYPIVLSEPPLGYLGGLAVRSGGRVIRVDDPRRMLSAYDIVVKELLGRYRIVYATSATGSHTADLTVAALGIRGTTAFVVISGNAPSSSSSAATSADFKGSTRRSTSSSVRLLAGLLLAGLIARLGWRVARRS